MDLIRMALAAHAHVLLLASPLWLSCWMLVLLALPMDRMLELERCSRGMRVELPLESSRTRLARTSKQTTPPRNLVALFV